MTASDALRRRAERDAASIIAHHNLSALGVPYDLLVAVTAVGWLEGYDASSSETQAAIRDTLAPYARAGLHSVKS